MTKLTKCHYEVLGVDAQADLATIKKQHRKLARKWHPDKNPDDESAVDTFRAIQQAYECLSNPSDRKWYDEHRDALLQGWSPTDGEASSTDFCASVEPYLTPNCYQGHHNDEGGFYHTYRTIFEQIHDEEERAWMQANSRGEEQSSFGLLRNFGTPDTNWEEVAAFYQAWQNFATGLSFAWVDPHHVSQDSSSTAYMDQRRIRRAMQEENTKARRAARKARNSEVLALVKVVKQRDPRVQAQRLLQAQLEREAQKQEAADRQRKQLQAKASREEWKRQAQLDMQQAEEADRLAGRVRLADLQHDYDYYATNKKDDDDDESYRCDCCKANFNSQGQLNNHLNSKKHKKAWKRYQEQEKGEGPGKEVLGVAVEEQKPLDDEPLDDADNDQEANLENQGGDGGADDGAETPLADEESDDESSQPDFWRCECCRKDFKSEGQMVNHMKSKKHKEAFKKFQSRSR